MFKSIRHQLIFMNCTLVTLAIVVSMSVSYYFISSGYERNIKQTNTVMAESLAANIGQFMQNAYNLNAQLAVNTDMLGSDGEKQKRVLASTKITGGPPLRCARVAPGYCPDFCLRAVSVCGGGCDKDDSSQVPQPSANQREAPR